MMIPFTMILTIYISMVVKHNRGLSVDIVTLGLVMREQNT